ncbi:hypothetical protein Tco_1513666, partial [Tanacetum coccineum]
VISSAAPVVETTLVASPTGLCGLVPYSDSDSDSPDEMSLSEHISSLLAISPFLCTYSSEAPDSSDGPPSQDSYVMTVTRWRRKVASRPSSSSEFPIAPVNSLPGIRRCSSSDSLPVHSSGLDAPDQAHSESSTKDRFFSSEASIEEDTEIDPIETEVDMELGIGDGDDVRDHVEIDPRDVGIDPMSTPIVEEEIIEPAREDSSYSSGTRDGIVRSFEDMSIDLDDVRRLEADQLIARGQRVSMIEMIDSLRLENLKARAMLDIKRDRVNSLRFHMSLLHEKFRQVRRDHDDTRGRLR